MPFALLLAAAVLSPAEPPAEKPLNVLLIVADDLGTQLGCYGDPTARTPRLDAFAKDATRYTLAYTAQASCSPTRSAIFTGLYPHRNGHYGLANQGFPVKDEYLARLLPNALKRAGVRAGLVGKLHVDPAGAFDWDMHAMEGFKDRLADVQLNAATDFVRGSEGQPWFLMYNLYDPHVTNGDFPKQVDGVPADPQTAADVPPWPWQRLDGPERRARIAGYYNCVERLDVHIGRLLDRLEELGRARDTVVLVTGDHGPPFVRGKTTCYHAGLRVPLLVRWPGCSTDGAGHVSEAPASFVDFYPTVLDALGVAPPGELHGRSLRPTVAAASPADWRDAVVGEFHLHGPGMYLPRRAICDGRFQLIHNAQLGRNPSFFNVDGDRTKEQVAALPADSVVKAAFERLVDPPEWELYDLREDPGEFVNLAGDPAVADDERRLQAALAAWREATDDPFGDPAHVAAVKQRVGRKNRK